MDASAAEKQKENLDIIPDDIRTKLENARNELEDEARKETSGAAKLAATNLAEAIATNKREEVSMRLRELRGNPDYKRLNESLRAKLDGLQAEVETTTEKGVRLTKEGTGKAVEFIGQLNPYVKYPLIAGLVAGGIALTTKFAAFIKRLATGTWDLGADIVEGAGKVMTNSAKATWSGIKMVTTVLGLTGLGISAYNYFNQPKELKKKA